MLKKSFIFEDSPASATVHKIEVNSDFAIAKMAQNAITAGNDMCTPQVNEMLHSSIDLEVIIPAGITSKLALLELYGEQLRFPDYYGVNWDAFDECLTDLSWLKEKVILIRHMDIPLKNDQKLVKIYLRLLSDAIEKWARSEEHLLRVCFPTKFKNDIELIENSLAQGSR